MSITSVFLLFAVIIPASSYAWGMRGTTIGGEKGAMLPGALIGAILALSSDILIVQENFFVFAALGAVAMYFGGCMTYGETLSFSMSAYPAVDMKKGLAALALKGFFWFGVFGAIFTTGVSAITNKYNTIDLIFIFVATPILALLGLRLFNRPHNKDEVKFPKIYFSKTRKEYWGALAGLLASLLLVNIIKFNWYVVGFTLICGLFGAIGWILGQLLQIYFLHKAKSSHLDIIRKCSDKGLFDSWKAMECTLGAVGGVGCTIAFLVTYNNFKEMMFSLELKGGLYELNPTLSKIFLVIWFILLALDMLHYFVKKPLSVAELKEHYAAGKIDLSEYTKKMFKALPQPNNISPVFSKFIEAYEFVVYAAIPFILICLGCSHAAQTMTFFMLYWVLAQEIGFENKFHRIPLTIFGLISLIIQFPLGINFSASSTFILYTVVYEVLSVTFLVKQMLEKQDKDLELNKRKQLVEEIRFILHNKSFLVTHCYFVICIILILNLI